MGRQLTLIIAIILIILGALFMKLDHHKQYGHIPIPDEKPKQVEGK